MGILAHYADTVTLVNRTIGGGKFERDLNMRYDGEDIVLHPGENPGIPRVAAQYAINQNPLMGTANPLQQTKYAICLVGVKADPAKSIKGTDCTPIAESVLAQGDEAMEVLDREGKYWDEPMAKVKVLRKKKTYNTFEARAAVSGNEAPLGGGTSE